jgi:hypothetical protein
MGIRDWLGGKRGVDREIRVDESAGRRVAPTALRGVPSQRRRLRAEDTVLEWTNMSSRLSEAVAASKAKVLR